MVLQRDRAATANLGRPRRITGFRPRRRRFLHNATRHDALLGSTSSVATRRAEVALTCNGRAASDPRRRDDDDDDNGDGDDDDKCELRLIARNKTVRGASRRTDDVVTEARAFPARCVIPHPLASAHFCEVL